MAKKKKYPDSHYHFRRREEQARAQQRQEAQAARRELVTAMSADDEDERATLARVLKDLSKKIEETSQALTANEESVKGIIKEVEHLPQAHGEIGDDTRVFIDGKEMLWRDYKAQHAGSVIKTNTTGMDFRSVNTFGDGAKIIDNVMHKAPDAWEGWDNLPQDQPTPPKAPPGFNGIGRRYFYSADVAKPKTKYGAAVIPTEVFEGQETNLIGSLLPNGNHAPVIDLDIPCQLLPSTTPGHYHLYIDRQVSWTRYQRLLAALVQAGLVQPGFVEGALRQGYTAVRPPGVMKPGTGGTLPDMQPQSIDQSVLTERESRIRALEETVEELNNEIIRRDQAASGWQ